MEIIIQGKHNTKNTTANLANVLRLFQERYHINAFREIHLSVTLVNEDGDDVELIDNETNLVYRIFEIHQQSPALTKKCRSHTKLKLVTDNTQSKA